MDPYYQSLISFFDLFQVNERVGECIQRYMSKEETARHLRDRYQIAYGCTEIGNTPFTLNQFNWSVGKKKKTLGVILILDSVAWGNIERWNPEFFRTYFENGAPSTQK